MKKVAVDIDNCGRYFNVKVVCKQRRITNLLIKYDCNAMCTFILASCNLLKIASYSRPLLFFKKSTVHE